MFSPFSESGIGLHTGALSSVSVFPGRPGDGIVFDVEGTSLKACLANLCPSARRCTALEKHGRILHTVEHLLAALAVLNIRDVRIAVSGPEIPILDGSAAIWFQRFLEAGARRGSHLLPLAAEPGTPIPVRSRESVADIIPVEKDADAFIEVSVDLSAVFAQPEIHRFYLASDRFEDIAPARTFAFEQDIQPLLNAMLARGGSLDNALVLSARGPLNPDGLRFANEPCRHKLLDVIGDLLLLGELPRAQIRIHCPGHHLNHEIARRLSAML